MKKLRTNVLVEIAILASMSMLIDYLDSFIKIGGLSISFSMVPIIILAIRRGPLPALLGNLVWVLLQLITGDMAGSIVHPAQFILDYPLAFGLLAVAGYANYNPTLTKILSWSTLAIFLRYLSHYFSGWIFFGVYAPEGQPAWLYSLLVNGQTFLINLTIILILLFILYQSSNQLFKPRN